jgi:hypothetical protein
MDMTAYKAIRKADRRLRAERGAKLKYDRVYICSPFRGDMETNAKKAMRYCRFAVKRGKFPIAPHIWLPSFMDDADQDERNLALSFGIRLLHGCREIWVFGAVISEGMRLELNEARRKRITIRYFNENCEEEISS